MRQALRVFLLPMDGVQNQIICNVAHSVHIVASASLFILDMFQVQVYSDKHAATWPLS